METYTTDLGLELLHIDLYRIEDPDELLLIGLDELDKRDYAWFIEWPQRGGSIVPRADMRINISYAGNARKSGDGNSTRLCPVRHAASDSS